jgi:regulator of RNase E activity RraB
MKWLDFLKPKKPQIEGDRWEVYDILEDDGFPAIICFDFDSIEPSNQKKYKHCQRIIIHFKEEQLYETRVPLKEANRKLNGLEKHLIGLLQLTTVPCRYVGRKTYDGKKEYIFQTDNPLEFYLAVELWSQQLHENGFSYDVTGSEGWDYFNEKISPKDVHWQRITDRYVIEKLIESGSNPQKKHSLEYVLLGSRPNLEKALQDLKGRGYQQVSFGRKSLVMSIESCLELDEVNTYSSDLFYYCQEHELQYDGWGALVVK